MRILQLTLIITCVLGSQAMAANCPTSAQVRAGLMESVNVWNLSASLQKDLAIENEAGSVATPILASVRQQMKDLKLTLKEEVDSRNKEEKRCVYYGVGDEQAVIINVKK